MIEGDQIIDREVADGPRKTFDRVRSDTLKQLETAVSLTQGYQPIDPHFGDVGIMMALGENFARVTEIANRSNSDGRLTDQSKPDRQDGDGSCLHCGAPFPNHNFACPLRNSAVPIRDAAEGAGERTARPYHALMDADMQGRKAAPPKPAPDAMREVLQTFTGAAHLHEDGSVQSWNIGGLFAAYKAAKAALAAPVPSPDGAANEAHHLAAVVATLKPTEEQDVEFFMRYFRDGKPEDMRGFIRSFRNQIINAAAGEMYSRLPPSAAGAAEPASEMCEVEPLYALPPVRGDREALRRQYAIAISIAYWARSERLARAAGDEPELQSILLRKPATPGSDYPAWTDCADSVLSLHVQPGAGEQEHHKDDNDRQVFFYEQDFYVLSNFSAFTLTWQGKRFDTSEAAYHWMKFMPDEIGIASMIREAPSAHEAFKLAEHYKSVRRKDWDSVKIGIMRDILRAKVEQHEYVRRKLLATGERELIEDSWRDDFWGWGPKRDGRNVLGKLWMEVRDELRSRQPPHSSSGGGR